MISVSGNKAFEHKDYYTRLASDNTCFISPVAIAEILDARWVRTLGVRRRKELNSLLASFQCLDIIEETAHEYINLDWRKKAPGMNDQWQVALASFHGLSFATLDQGLVRAGGHLVEML